MVVSSKGTLSCPCAMLYDVVALVETGIHIWEASDAPCTPRHTWMSVPAVYVAASHPPATNVQPCCGPGTNSHAWEVGLKCAFRHTLVNRW